MSNDYADDRSSIARVAENLFWFDQSRVRTAHQALAQKKMLDEAYSLDAKVVLDKGGRIVSSIGKRADGTGDVTAFTYYEGDKVKTKVRALATPNGEKSSISVAYDRDGSIRKLKETREEQSRRHSESINFLTGYVVEINEIEAGGRKSSTVVRNNRLLKVEWPTEITVSINVGKLHFDGSSDEVIKKNSLTSKRLADGSRVKEEVRYLAPGVVFKAESKTNASGKKESERKYLEFPILDEMGAAVEKGIKAARKLIN